MRYSYYPGCTLYNKAKDFDDSARRSCQALGIELVELPHWYCCGAIYPQSQDHKIPLIAPFRVLAKAKNEGLDLVTLCSFCYHVLKRVNYAVNNDKEKLDLLNDFLNENYRGDQKVLHLLEVLRDDVGFDRLAQYQKKDLSKLKVAPYYGCYLLRPQREIGLDDQENPMILNHFLSSLGIEVIDSPHKVECCGSYLVLVNRDATLAAVRRIIEGVKRLGAEAIATSCPLCHYNLDKFQAELKKEGLEPIPVFYFTQLLALFLGLERISFTTNKVPVEPYLREKIGDGYSG
ncbi:disulfide reductase [candidate division WOR-3 bacterium]|uniref:Disulfide reductase n=1 Tax=candidate division WOR-3 bacterium TaxID=2052148 RepID=A0A660SNG1_UNCW3|nr:MAG: disulfide reductase [candidate division WOR-3 bacterium]